MPILSNLIVRIGASTDDFDRKVNSSLNKIKRFASDVTTAGTALSIGFSLPLIAAGAGALKAAGDMDVLQRALLTTAGSAAEASTQFSRLAEIAKLPGIGLEEAVRGSIRLQNYGMSAGLAEKALRGVSNAVAGAGGSAEDTGEALRQMGQIWGRQKVTMDNLRIVLERVPQSAKIIREEFGAEALADPANALEKLGVNSEKFLTILIEKLGDAPKVTAGFKTEMENLRQSFDMAAAAVGEVLIPTVTRLITETLTPGIEEVKAFAEAFKLLPTATQNWAIGLTAVMTAAPIVIVALGTLVEKSMVLLGVIVKLRGPLAAVGRALANLRGVLLATGSAMAFLGGEILLMVKNWELVLALFLRAGGPIATAIATTTGLLFGAGAAGMAAGAGVGLFMKMLMDHGGKPVDTTAEAIKNLNKNFEGQIISSGQAGDAIIGYMRLLRPAETASVALAVKAKADAHKGAAAATAAHTEVVYANSVAQLVEMEAVSRGGSAWAMATKAIFGFLNAYQPWGDKIALHASDTGRLAMATEEYRQALDRLANVKMVDIAPRDVRRGSVLEADDILSRAGGTSSRQQSLKVAGLEADLARIKQLNKEGKATGNDVIAIQQALKKEIDGTGKAAEVAGEKQVAAMRQVSLVVNDLAKGIAKVIFGGGSKIDTLPMRRNIDELKQSEKDLLSQQKSGKDVTNQLIKVRMDLAEAEDKLTDAIKRQGRAYQALQAFKNIGLDIAQSITRAGIEYALMKISKQVLGLIGDFGNLGGIMAKVFGGGLGAAKAVPALNPVINAAGGIGGAIGSAAPAASSAIGGAAAASPIVGMVMAVASVVSAISAVVANFQFAAMNKSLDIIVKHTLQAANDLANLRADEWTREGHLMAKLDDLWRTNLGIYDLLGKGIGGMGGGGGSTFNITVTGGDTRAVMENLTRMLKLHGAIPANA